MHLLTEVKAAPFGFIFLGEKMAFSELSQKHHSQLQMSSVTAAFAFFFFLVYFRVYCCNICGVFSGFQFLLL
jgi:hypothetical protein